MTYTWVLSIYDFSLVEDKVVRRAHLTSKENIKGTIHPGFN